MHMLIYINIPSIYYIHIVILWCTVCKYICVVLLFWCVFFHSLEPGGTKVEKAGHLDDLQKALVVGQSHSTKA